jgi:uncharacterized protein YcbK (DUF882 family)
MGARNPVGGRRFLHCSVELRRLSSATDHRAQQKLWPDAGRLQRAHGGKPENNSWEDGKYVPGALHEVDYLFRDFRANEIKNIDLRLLNVLYDLRLLTTTAKPIDLVSGYRSYATNAMLAARSGGVAQHSMHIEGKAL